ncbi:MAG: hypothetical protein WCK65_07745 [Rhodospirillaceae bacterium]
MTIVKISTAFALLTLLGLGEPGTAWAQAGGSGATGNAPVAAESGAAPLDPNAMTDGEKQAVGCAITATGAMIATYIAGPSEITLLWGGGLLIPSGSAALALSLLGQIGTTFCAIGALAAPTVLWFYDQSDAIAAKLAQSSTRVGSAVMTAFAPTPAMKPAPIRQLADGSSALVQ